MSSLRQPALAGWSGISGSNQGQRLLRLGLKPVFNLGDQRPVRPHTALQPMRLNICPGSLKGRPDSLYFRLNVSLQRAPDGGVRVNPSNAHTLPPALLPVRCCIATSTASLRSSLAALISAARDLSAADMLP